MKKLLETIAGARGSHVAVALVAFAAGGFLIDLWVAPATAEEALEAARAAHSVAEANSEAIDRLHPTIRIYICSREDLEYVRRFRLDGIELD